MEYSVDQNVFFIFDNLEKFLSTSQLIIDNVMNIFNIAIRYGISSNGISRFLVQCFILSIIELRSSTNHRLHYGSVFDIYIFTNINTFAN